MKSAYFQQIFLDKMAKKKSKDEKLVIDFNGTVLWEAFRKIIDYFYLNDLTVLDSVSDFTEILEIIKLSKLYKLNTLFKAAEALFQEIIPLGFDNYSIFTLKPNKLINLTPFNKRAGVIQGKKTNEEN